MIRFFRNLLLFIIIVTLVAYAAIWFGGRYVTDRIEEPLFNRFVRTYGVADDGNYTYSAGVKLWPPRVQLDTIVISGGELLLDGDTFEDALITVERVDCELLPLVKTGEVVITSFEGRTFEGRITNDDLADRLERENEGLSELTIDVYNDRCLLRGRFGRVNVSTISLFGDWVVDDRGVVTLVNREYHNPDSPVPAGMVEMIEEQITLDLRIDMFDHELPAKEVEFGAGGLSIKAGDD